MATTKKQAKPKPVSKVRTYAFEPGDWFEGGNDGHPFELRFAKAPNDAAKAAIATTFERAVQATGATSASSPWIWHGPWALFFAGERESGKGATRAALDGIAAAVTAVHAVHPVEWLIFLGARELTLPAAKDRPPPGPEWDAYDFRDDIYGRGERFTAPTTPGPDGGFEAARAEAAGRKPAAAAVDHPFVLRASPLKEPRVTPKIAKRLHAQCEASMCREIAGVTYGTKSGVFLFLDGDTSRTIPMPDRVDHWDVRADHQRAAAVLHKHDELVELALPAGTPAKVAVPNGVSEVRYVDGGKLLVVCSYRELVLLAPDGARLASLSFEFQKDGLVSDVYPVLGGRAVVLALDNDDRELCVVAIGARQLVVVGRTEALRVTTAFERDGHVVVSGQETTNLRALVDAALA